MTCAWLSRRVFRRPTGHLARLTPSEPSSSDSRTLDSTSEIEVSQEAQEQKGASQTVDTEELRKTQPPIFELLPAELILLVSELLPDTDAICLALTCKRMCNISNVGYLARRLDRAGTETLLLRLEQDITGVSYCPVSLKLMPFDIYKSAGVCMHTHSQKRLPPDARFGGTLRIPYCTARVVTNYQILGLEHGIPTSDLKETLNHRLCGHGVCWKEELTAKVINGELFAFSRHTFYPERADAGALQTCLSNRIINLCPHIAVGKSQRYRMAPGSVSFPPPTLLGLPISLIGNCEDYGIGFCRKCETDWEISIKKDPQRGWTVTIRTYHGLGTCRSPWNGKWHDITTGWIVSKQYRQKPRNVVKALWRT